MELQEHRIPGEGGLEIHVLEWSREGVPFVMLHGFGNDAHIWDEFAPVIAPHYRAVAVDLRGHGDSAWDAERRYDYDFHIGDLERVTAALGIERFVLMGHSLGGRVATLFAGKHPERLAGFVLVDSGPDLDPRGVTRIRVDVEKMATGADSFASPAHYERVLTHAYPAVKTKILARMASHGLRERPDGRFERKTDPAFHAGRAAMSETEAEERERAIATRLWEALAKVTCPALVVRGAASDILSPDCAEKIAEEVLAKGQLAIVARAGHSVMVDNPEGFAEAVSAFALG
jgi:pimeloyl-ACP methyl ester carboxylesterase